MTAAAVSPTVMRIQPGAVVLLVLACTFAVAAGYGWFGESLDYSNYLGTYSEITPHGSPPGSRFEPGYVFFSWLCKTQFGMDFSQYYTLLAATALLLKFRLIWKHTSAPLVAAIVYLMLLFPVHEYTQIRAAVAFGFTYTAIDEYLDGKRLAAIFLLAAGTLFHFSALLLAGAAALVLFASHRSVMFAAIFFVLTAVAAYFILSTGLHVLDKVAPLVSHYINKPFLAEPPSAIPRRDMILVASSAILLRPWQDRRDGFFFLMCLFSLPLYIALLKVPVLAVRTLEAFTFSYFFFTFRFDDFHRSRIPALLMALSGAGVIYVAMTQKMISL